jgi:tetratricopeptide (TPR) repeat protein
MVRLGTIEAHGGPHARGRLAGICVLLLLAAGHGMAADRLAACAPTLGRVVSVQGTVEILRSGGANWERVARLNTPVCAGDQLRAGLLSRAAIFISPETLVRLDQNTTLAILSQTEQETVVEFKQDDATRSRASRARACGIGYFITRFPRKFRVRTPFYNAVVEGTEFQVALQCDRGDLSVFEGKVVAEDLTSAANRVVLESGQSVSVGSGEAPKAVKVLVKPADAVQWAVYYPPISDAPVSVEAVLAEDCAVIAGPDRAACVVRHAEGLLRVGRVAEAGAELDRLLESQSNNAEALALNAVIAIAKIDKTRALELATRATQVSPQSFRAWVALSYARQAGFRLEDALSAANKAGELAPKSALVRARVAELLMSLGRIREAEREARQAVNLNPNESRAHLILGFAHLAQIDTKAAKQDFNTAIESDSTEPLARLGLGLATIREGKLADGREQIEIAVALDPTNSLLRSYVGKAYYEENRKERDALAATQFGIAKKLDPNDPTPWLYDAILAQAENRPIAALHDLQTSIGLNDNRAVFRSRLLLDQDLATRQVNLARTYTSLGFQQLALEEASRSVDADFGSSSAHRFLSDTYLSLPRHEVARVSELLQAEIRSPLMLTPVQPLLSQDKLFVVPRAAPAGPVAQEYSPLFEKDGWSATLDGAVGDISGDQVAASLLHNRTALSAGQLYEKTDGFRPNNDLERKLYNVFGQQFLEAGTSVQIEGRYEEQDHGDLAVHFDPNKTLPARFQTYTNVGRIGAFHQIGPDQEVLASAIYARAPVNVTTPGSNTGLVDESTTIEVQHVARADRVRLISGLGYVWGHQSVDTTIFIDPSPPIQFTDSFNRSHLNAYAYATLSVVPNHLELQVGASYDRLDEPSIDREQFNPKIGVLWSPNPTTRLRAAYFEGVKRTFTANQTLEPTQVAGFNQLFDDPNGADPKRWGVAIDQRLTRDATIGLEASGRRFDYPIVLSPATNLVQMFHRQEWANRAYAYWTVGRSCAVGADYFFERLDDTSEEPYTTVTTQRAPISVTYFLSPSWTIQGVWTAVHQSGTFNDANFQSFRGTSSFTTLDAALIFRLPGRRGTISLEGKNLLDRSFNYEETDPASPRIALTRVLFARVNLQF